MFLGIPLAFGCGCFALVLLCSRCFVVVVDFVLIA